MVNCPQCGNDELDLVGHTPGGGRRIRCPNCGNEWVRGDDSEPPSSGQVPRSANPSAVESFENNDAGYLRWTSRHGGGFILNTLRPPTGSYLFLHTAQCWHITVPDDSYTDSSWTGNQYMKICASRRQDLIAWAVDRFGREPDRCQTCDP